LQKARLLQSRQVPGRIEQPVRVIDAQAINRVGALVPRIAKFNV
jgi:hypothetical protein